MIRLFIKNEFGWIEEIAIMHVIIKTWDNHVHYCAEQCVFESAHSKLVDEGSLIARYCYDVR